MYQPRGCHGVLHGNARRILCSSPLLYNNKGQDPSVCSRIDEVYSSCSHISLGIGLVGWVDYGEGDDNLTRERVSRYVGRLVDSSTRQTSGLDDRKTEKRGLVFIPIGQKACARERCAVLEP